MQERARDTASSQARAEQPRLQGLRDVERWKEKIEIRLDNRQVAFLFFGSALIACLLFILGVVVGKRLESRGHAMAPEIEDPLALLDRVAATVPAAPVARTLSNVAIGRAHAAAKLEKSERSEKGEKAAPGETGKRGKPDDAALAALAPTKLPPADQLESEKPEKLVAKLVAEAAGTKPKAELPATTATPAPPAAAPKPSPTPPPPAPPAPVAATAKPVALPTASSVRAVATSPPPTAANPELLPPSTVAPARATPPAASGRARFMLQVGSFLDRAEAEAFASTFSAEKPVVVTSEIPGKGTWYRVRLGGFEAFDQAVQAKLSFERRYSKIALVVGPL